MPSETLRMSPSASDTLADCPRKWYYGYVCRIPSGPNESRDTGSEVHDLAEKWLKTGDPALKAHQHWGVLAPGLAHLEPGVEWNIETWVEGNCGPLPAVGKIDFWRHTPGLLHVGDWKTTGKPGFKYAKSSEGLAKATQPLFYAKLLGNRYGRRARLNFQHINLCISEPAAKSVVAEDVAWEAVDERWAFLETQAIQMQELSVVKGAEDVPVDTRSCRKYGGCPYADRCPASPDNRRARVIANFPDEEVPMGDRTNAATSSFLDFLGAGGKAQPIAAPEVPPEPDAVARAVEALRAVQDEGLLTDAIVREFAASHKADPAAVIAALGFGAPAPKATEAPSSPETALREYLLREPTASTAEQKAVVKTALGRVRMSDAEFEAYRAKVLGAPAPAAREPEAVVTEAENPRVYEDTERDGMTKVWDYLHDEGEADPETLRPREPQPLAFLGCFPEDGGFTAWETARHDPPAGDVFVPLSQEAAAIPTLRQLGYRIIRGAL